MWKPRTRTLLLLGVCLLLVASLFLRGITMLRPVLTPTGEPVLQPNGKPLLRFDPLRQLKVNWEAHTLVAGSLFCLGWSAVRGVRYLYEKAKRQA
jgi:hypothetical protein